MITDEQLVARAQAGDRDAAAALAARYTQFAYAKARTYTTPRTGREDMRQEALCGLLGAIRNYQPGRGATFRSFAALCINRWLYTVLKTDLRQMRHSVEGPLSLDVQLTPGEPESMQLHEQVADRRSDVPATSASRAQVRALVRTIREDLTPLERESLIGLAFLDETYAATEERILGFDADRPGRAAYSKVKVVDNALTRARRKIRFALAEADAVPLGRAA